MLRRQCFRRIGWQSEVARLNPRWETSQSTCSPRRTVPGKTTTPPTVADRHSLARLNGGTGVGPSIASPTTWTGLFSCVNVGA
jgi:hypothetical protein